MLFHDAVEMFLLLAAENLGIKDSKNREFMQYWHEIPSLTMEAQMNSLKNKRRSLKHHGTFPSHDDVEECRINVGEFFAENVKIQFGIDFSKVSLVDLVSFKKTRECLNEAQEELKVGNYYKCLALTRQAFIELLTEFESTKGKWYKSIFNVGREPRKTYDDVIRTIDKNKYSRNVLWFEDVDKTIIELRNVVKLAAIGVDYKRYALFNAVAPNVWKDRTGAFHVKESEGYFNDMVKADEELCDMCINFIIDCAVELQNSDYNTSKYLVKSMA